MFLQPNENQSGLKLSRLTSSATTFFYVFAVLLLFSWQTHAMDNLRVAYQWRALDYAFPSAEHRTRLIDAGDYVPENNLPLGLEVYGDRLFITVPRWKDGVAASLTYIRLSEDAMDSPKLRPYPNWEAHKLTEYTKNNYNATSPTIVSPFRVRADRCGRLWVLDTGVANLLGDAKVHAPASLIVFDLKTDRLLRRYVIPERQLRAESFLANIAVEEVTADCGRTYAYLGDLAGDRSGLIVYSWHDDRSWRVEHHYFNVDPLAGEFNVSGIAFQWTDGLFGLALSAPNDDDDGYRTLYFHPLTSTHEFYVSTRYLREEAVTGEAKRKNFNQFRVLGTRGPRGQSGVSFLDQETNVLFYALVNLNAIACWRIPTAKAAARSNSSATGSYTMRSQGRVFMSNETMVFPNDVKVDPNGNLWVLSDRLPSFMYRKLDYDDVNFRVLTAPVKEAIKGTACDSKLIVNVTNRVGKTESGGGGVASAAARLVAFFAVLALANALSQ